MNSTRRSVGAPWVLCLVLFGGCGRCASDAVDTGDTSVTDADGDGYKALADCNDDDAAVNPGASEWCNGVDDDCDGLVDIDDDDVVDPMTVYTDADGDGYGDADAALEVCFFDSSVSQSGGDCDDTNAAINPDADEVCDELDNDCDGDTDELSAVDACDWYEDSDGDGFGNPDSTQRACYQPTGFVDDKRDCNDTVPTTQYGCPWVTVAAGGAFNCAMDLGGSVECWGDNDYGQTECPEDKGTFLRAGSSHACMVTTDGTGNCWGRNDSGQAEVSVGQFTVVAPGEFATCGIKTDGWVYCWGSNTAELLEAPAGEFVDAGVGSFHGCAISAEGTIACWGGAGVAPYYDQALPPSGTFTQLAVGADHNCAIAEDASVICWGNNGQGESSPPAETFTKVDVGWVHSCGIRASDGHIECWGCDDERPCSAPDRAFVDVSTGWDHTCALTDLGEIECWGCREYDGGQCESPEVE